MILNQAQAQAAYNAMCALNNGAVVAHADCGRYGTGNPPLEVAESADGYVAVGYRLRGLSPIVLENHSSQAAFAAAYGLQ